MSRRQPHPAPQRPLSPRPLYHQIRETLRERLAGGEYPPLAPLPSERQLIAAFGVSRITVRQALRDLQHEGLLFTVPGKGCFAAQPRAVQELARLEGFAEAMTPQGHETHSRVVALGTVKATERVAAALGLAPGAAVVELRRVRYLDRAPVSFDVSYFAPEIGRRLAQSDLATRDVFAILEHDLGLSLEAAELGLEATLADGALARQLGVPVGSAVLRIERLTCTRGQRPIDFEYLHCVGSAYRYRLRVERARPAPAELRP